MDNSSTFSANFYKQNLHRRCNPCDKTKLKPNKEGEFFLQTNKPKKQAPQ